MRYYSTLRPVAPGTFPKNESFVGFVNYDNREDVGNGIEAWGYVEYLTPLSDDDIAAYDLVSSDLKRWYAVTSMVYDNGKCIMKITDNKLAVEKPESTCKSLRNRDVWVDWFESLDAANKFIDENN